jgi:hypothetical protein
MSVLCEQANASTCNTYGNSTYCSDGTSYNTYGNTTYGSDGTTYNTYGNTTYVNGPGGYSGTANTYGNSTYYSGSYGDSYTANTYGNTTYISGSNGANGTISNYGNTSYGSGNAFYTCPTNSHTSLTDSTKCTCNSGYVVSGSSCVYDYSYYSKPSCPINSYSDGSSCKCNYGYVVSGSSCVYKSNYGSTYYPSTYSSSVSCPINSSQSVTDSTKCSCNTGYQVNSTKDACILIPVVTKTNDQRCSDEFGINSMWAGTGTVEKGLDCKCNLGYSWNSSKTSCIYDATKLRYSFDINLTIGSTGSDVVALQTALISKGYSLPSIIDGTVAKGYYGSQTKNAVKAWQTDNNLMPTGNFDYSTRLVFNKSL